MLCGGCQRILYDSATGSISLTKISASLTPATMKGKAKTRSKQVQSQSQIHSSKKISNSQRERLVQTVIRNEFFRTDIFYSPDPMAQDYTLMVLAVKFEDKSHTTIWADTSTNVPNCLNLVIETLKEVAK